MIFFRVDLGFKEGLGHYNRIKSLIRYLKIKKYKIIIDKFPKGSFLNKDKRNILSLYENSQFINEKNDAQKFSTIISNYAKLPIIIKDSYRLGYKWEKIISKKSKKLIIIDDFCEKRHYVDYYINHNPSFSNKNKNLISFLKKRNKRKTKFLLGEDYALFNSNKDKNKKINSDLVFYNGGSGNILIYEKIIKKILNKEKKLKIILIIGPFAKNYKIICKKFKSYKNILIEYQPQNISNILIGTKVFISSASTSMFESSFFKIPSLLFKMNSNQSLKDYEYEKLGHYFNLNKEDLNLTNKVAKLITLMVKNRHKIQKLMSKSSINLKKIEKNYKKSINFNYE